MNSVNLSIVIWGCVGGLIPDLLRIIKGRYGPVATYVKYWNFWLSLILLFALGGFIAWLAGATDVKQALAYGFGGPEIITKLLSQQGGAAIDRGEGDFRLLRWWKG